MFWALWPIALTLMLAAAQIPVLLVTAIALPTFAWVQRDRWAWPRWQRRTTFAIVIVVGLAFLAQRVL